MYICRFCVRTMAAGEYHIKKDIINIHVVIIIAAPITY